MACVLALVLCSVYMWRRVPIIVIFGGAYAKKGCMQPIVVFLQCVRMFSPIVLLTVDELDADWWCPYTPLDDEIDWFLGRGWSVDKAVELAEKYTREADESTLSLAMALAFAKCRRHFGWGARPLWVVGFSNGVIPAVEFAVLCSAAVLWTASGVPSNRQRVHTLGAFTGKLLVTFSENERYWQNAYHAVRDTEAAHQRREYLIFKGGRHAREDESGECLAWVRSRLLGM